MRQKAITLVGAILVATLFCFLLLSFIPPLIASGLLAYSFGLRHGVDADHIAAIDNVTRRLTTGGRQPVSVGFFFALGHSMVVTTMCVGVAVASGFIKEHMDSFAAVGGVVGACISGVFLLVIGSVNLYSAIQLRAAWREQASYGGHTHEIASMCMKCCPGLFEDIKHPWQMLPVGFLFGLGFDTSSEIGLLGVVAVSRGHVPRVCIMILPLLFMAGMCLIDTVNGVLMSWAYGRAMEDPMQRLYYNLFLTSTSGAIALAVGGVELLGVVASAAGLRGCFWDGVANINDHFEDVGFMVIGFFALSMLLAVGCFRRVFPGGKPLPDPARQQLLRYLDNGVMIDRSGV